MIIIKLGGSVITKKGDYATLNSAVVDTLSRALSGYKGRESLIIVHGAGSFGHILAKKYSLKNPSPSADLPMGISKVQRDVRQLNLLIMNSLIDHGIPAASIPPAVCSELEDGTLVSFDSSVFRRFLDQNTIPVTFGDVVPDRKRGVSILSGDTIMEQLAIDFTVSKAVFVLDVDGFFDRPPNEDGAEVYRELDAEALEGVLRTTPVSSKNISEVVDITGSIRGKMESVLRIARSGTDCYLVNGREGPRISDILNDSPTISTKVKGVKR